MNHKHYTYRILWSVDDNEHVGLCAEFPSLSYLDADMIAALQGIVGLVEQVVADMAANDEPIPGASTQTCRADT